MQLGLIDRKVEDAPIGKMLQNARKGATPVLSDDEAYQLGLAVSNYGGKGAHDTEELTDAEARTAQLGALRKLGGPGRVQQVFGMPDEARRISVAGLLARSRNLSPAEARAIVLRRILGAELYDAAYDHRSR